MLHSGDGQRVIRQLTGDELNRMIASRTVIWHYVRGANGEERMLGVRVYTAPHQSRTAYANDCEHSSGAMKSSDTIMNRRHGWPFFEASHGPFHVVADDVRIARIHG